MRYSFGDCVFDVDSMTLQVAGAPVALQPQVFDVLKTLIEERHRVMTKEELLDRVWGHNFVTESALTSRIKTARQAIGDDGREQRLIRTVHGRGYQFVGEVSSDDDRSSSIATNVSVTHHHLPAFASDLIGRHDDLRLLGGLLDEARLVTVTGPGGVGKTRLAVACATGRGQPAVFADLTTVRDPSLVLTHIATEIGLKAMNDDPMATIGEYVAGRDLLLLVDNVEHVIDAAVDLAELVRRVDDLTVLATSRERLRVDGERVFVLDPLPTTDRGTGADAAATELFVRTARSVAPDLDTDRYRRFIERICDTVDGLPLAIELVAGQARTLPPDILSARLGERLRSASATRRDAPERQRTMAATIEWSVRLLDTDEVLLFGRLGAFVGDASLEMIEAVCGDERLPDPVDVLTRLVDKSLVRSRRGEDGILRFGMLELLRARAAELLAASDDGDAVAERHALVIADRVEEVDRERWGSLVSTWPDVLTHLLPEFRRAHDWAVEHDDWELAGRLAASFGAFWHREGGLAEARRRLRSVLAHEDELTPGTRARLLAATGIVTWDDGDVLAARELWQRAADELEALGELATLSYVLAGTAVTTLDDPELHDWASALLERAVTLARGCGRPAALTEVLNMRGEFARGTGDDALARASYSETVQLATEIGDVSMERVGLANLAYVECHEGNFDEARRLGRIALRACSSGGRRLMAAWSLGELAIPACGLGEHELAARLLGASQRAMAALGAGRYPADVAEDERVINELVEVMGRAEFDHYLAEGAMLTLDQAVAIALDDRPATVNG